MTDLFALFLQPLESGGFEYMVGGSVAAMTYGEPRLTNDIDIVLDLGVQDLDRLAEVFPEEEYYRAPFEVLRMELARASRGHTNFIHHSTGFRADVYFRASDPLHSWAWPRRMRIATQGGLQVSIAPVEYVILRKLEYYSEGGSEKHLSDIRGILELAPELRDSGEISAWSERLGVLALWLNAAQPG